MIKGKIVAIDFDGTITKENIYPSIGELRDGVVDAINTIAENNTVVIWTCRTDKPLLDAHIFLKKNNIHYDYMNKSPLDKLNQSMRKIIADYYIDDRNIFCNGNVDWKQIKEYFLNSN